MNPGKWGARGPRSGVGDRVRASGARILPADLRRPLPPRLPIANPHRAGSVAVTPGWAWEQGGSSQVNFAVRPLGKIHCYRQDWAEVGTKGPGLVNTAASTQITTRTDLKRKTRCVLTAEQGLRTRTFAFTLSAEAVRTPQTHTCLRRRAQPDGTPGRRQRSDFVSPQTPTGSAVSSLWSRP